MVKGTLIVLLAVFSTASMNADLADPSATGTEGGRASTDSKSADFEAKARKLRESELLKLDPIVAVRKPGAPDPFASRYPWKNGIVTTVFWVGRGPGKNNGKTASAWDRNWSRSFGGFDDPNPDKRKDFIAAKFLPRQNPFYVALPYNDVADGKTKPEVRLVIPWFKETFVEEGKSVCQDRWVAIRNSVGKVCYAQWSDCGPFLTDHWQYVFGNERPKPNVNQGAGLEVSPAVRDFLGLSKTDVTDWKFADLREVPRGPWSTYGGNNQFLMQTERPLYSEKVSSPPVAPSTPAPKATVPEEKSEK